MFAPDELVQAEEDQHPRTDVAQRIERDQDLGYPNNQNRYQDGECVSQGYGRKGLQDGTPSPLLQAQGHRKEPAHRRVKAVVGSQKGQRKPGPALAQDG